MEKNHVNEAASQLVKSWSEIHQAAIIVDPVVKTKKMPL